MNRVLAEGCQGKIRSVRAFENAGVEVRGGDEGVRGKGGDMISNALGEQIEPAKPVIAKVVEAMRPRLGNSDFKNSQGSPSMLGLEVFAVYDRPGF
ncbi:hypothetical protein ALC53_13439 [Atta colombica]|uniref:Uncharacterized protein n=1 Tax=Atta colombica TaxID=520822 RepID=A0A151HXU4_9HYME|nr:hypothetical protein ALC53_13439 [Atta colombica]